MKTPLYIQNLLSRCEWAVEAGRLPKGCDPGYTLLLHKRSAYALAKTLAKEADALKGWAEREMLQNARSRVRPMCQREVLLRLNMRFS